MIERVVDFSIRNSIVVFAIVVALSVAGWRAMTALPLDAIPDLSDTQVIVYSRWDRSPDVVEDQVTYPIVSALQGAPRVRAVRGVSDFGFSFVYVIFDDGTDPYWARARTLEYLSVVLPRLPEGVRTELGPDATALGWVFQYVLVDDSGTQSLADLRALQDWHLRYHLRSVAGVSEVAAVGGFGRQYQVVVDPVRLRAHDIPIERVVEAVRGGNDEVGGRLIEIGGAEYMVRGRGWAASAEDFERIVLRRDEAGTPVRVGDVGDVTVGPEPRRGLADLDGTGEVVSGIVVLRHGQNALAVIDRVKRKIAEIAPGLPAGVRIVPVYDRSELIHRAIDQLRATLLEVIFVVSLVILLFLRHVPSAAIPIVTIPVAVLISFLPFHALGLTANIMSLAGIAVAIGALVDAAIVVVEQTHKGLEAWDREGRPGDEREVVRAAILQVAGPAFFSLLVLAVSFLPVLALGAEEGRLFRPLAWTKTCTLFVAALLAITFDPALRMLLTRARRLDFRPAWLSRLASAALVGRIRAEEQHFLSRRLVALYAPAAEWALAHKRLVVGLTLVALASTVPAFLSLGSEFMPPLDEGALFYMPTTMPGISAGEAQRLLQATDRILMGFPEVERVLGKAGRADTATDPAPLSMFETVVILKPRDAWREKPAWYSGWAPEWSKPLLRRVTADRISRAELVDELDRALRLPGLSNAWTMPIKARIDMLATGIRTPVGLKVTGPDLAAIDAVGRAVETALQRVPGARSVFAERAGSGYFLDIVWDRDELARHGIGLSEAQAVVATAIGGEEVTTTVEGRRRHTVSVRYPSAFRSSVESLAQVLVPVGEGETQIPLGQLARIALTTGPAMIRDEGGLLTSYVYVDLEGRDPQGFVREADARLRESVQLPVGCALSWSGQYEAMERAAKRLRDVVPLTLLLVFILLWLNTRSLVKTAIVAAAVPFSAIGAVWLLWVLGYEMSVGVWVGIIALLGVDAETGVFMLLYLDLAYDKARRAGRLRSRADLRTAVLEGSVRRLRPKFMTTVTTVVGLLPILWATGTGADVMKRIAAPLVGGIVTSFLLELLVYPVIYESWKWRSEVRQLVASAPCGDTVPAGGAPASA